MTKYILTAIIMLSFHSVFAVDGYQDIKFGTSYESLKKMNKCTLTQDTSQSTKHLKVYGCTNFKFGEKTVPAMFYLIDNKLLRVGFIVGDSSEDFFAFTKALNTKFGDASRKPASEELELYDQGKAESVDMSWDVNTVILRQYRSGLNQATLLIYSSPNYEPMLLQSKTKGITDAL